ncbi:MAG: hypothetical protein LUG99_09455 [Lachnospiraceae bacterium]|nr:hypothetical protein [Lachnospiraceae bacterium]
MSEVQDACQIVIVTGKSAYWIGKITTQLTMMILKLMNTIYLAKWKGATTLNRFRNIKGDDFMFINASTEDKALLQHIEKEMEDHGILLARLPDLCGGDGRTQYVISPSDSAKFKAFLLDHNAGRYRDVKVGPISAEDYARSGIDRNGRETPEMQELSRSANEVIQEQKQIGVRQSAGYLTMQESTARAAWSLRVWGRRREPVRQPARQSDRQPAREYTELPLTSPMVQYNLVRHDEQATEQGNISWISKAPLKRHEKWAMYEMPDGIHTVIIPKSDLYQLATRNGIAYRAAIYAERMYQVVNMKNGAMELSSGLEVAEAMRKPDIRTENERMKNLAHNRGLDAEMNIEKIESRETPERKTNAREIDAPGPARTSLSDGEKDSKIHLEEPVSHEPRVPQKVSLPATSGISELKITGTIGDMGELGFRDTYYVSFLKDGQERYVEFPYSECDLSADRKTLTVRLRDDQEYDVFYNDTGSITREKVNGADLRSIYDSEARSFVSDRNTSGNQDRTVLEPLRQQEKSKRGKQKKNPAVKRTRPVKPRTRR